eukprot:c32032_g1_i1 orf=185-349(+)
MKKLLLAWPATSVITHCLARSLYLRQAFSHQHLKEGSGFVLVDIFRKRSKACPL